MESSQALGASRGARAGSDLLASLADERYAANPERVFLLHVEAWDINCRQHIKRRFTEDELGPDLRALTDRVAELEAEARELRARAAGEKGQNGR